MALDFRQVGPRRTEIVLYRPSIGHKPILKSVRAWAGGEDAGCPKLR